MSKVIADMLKEVDAAQQVEEKVDAPIVEPEKETAPVIDIKEEKSVPEVIEPVKEETSEEKPEVAKDEPEIPKKKYADKYDTIEDLEKSYKELQSAFSKKSQAVSEKVKETEALLDDREFQNKLSETIENKAISLIEKSFATISDEDARKKGAEYLMAYKSTGDIRYIENYYNCLEPSVDRQLQKQLTQVALETRQDFNSRRSEIIYEPVKKELLEIEAEDPEFLKENQEILVQAIRNNPKTSVREIRDLIKQVEEKAIKNYQKSLKSGTKVEKSAVIPTHKVESPKPEDTPKKPLRLMSVKELLLNE